MHVDFDELLESAISRDKKSLEFIFDKYFDMIYFYIEKKVNHFEDAEDISSKVWEKVYLNLDKLKYKDEKYFKNWIFQIARNSVIDFFRKRNQEILKIENDIENNLTSELNPFDLLKDKESESFLKMLVSKLPKKQGKCIELRFFDWIKNKEIAKQLNVNEVTVASNIKRWLLTLKQNLKE